MISKYSSSQTLAKGAEALILKKDAIIQKVRSKKSYRHPVLDEKIRKLRTRKEANLLKKASEIIFVPSLISVSEHSKIIEMEYLPAKKLSLYLSSLPNAIQICTQLGLELAKLHDASIIHGDLTTSNILLKKNKVYLIDFGLAFQSHRIEDKAVDLHVFWQSLQARHSEKAVEFFNAVLAGYKISPSAKEVLTRLKIVEKRGRYKQSY